MITHWQTWNDRVVDMATISHQHISNIYHFINTIVPHLYLDSVRNDINTVIQSRFNGVILQYAPHPDFHNEKLYLKRMGYLKSNGEIIVNNKKIGAYVY